MGIVALLLDKAREGSSLASDNALAARIGKTRQVVSQWRHGESYPSEEQIAQLAKLAHADPGEWLIRVNAERSTGEAHKAWTALARKFGAAAALALCAVVVPVSTGISDVSASPHYVGLHLTYYLDMAPTGLRLPRTFPRTLRAALPGPQPILPIQAPPHLPPRCAAVAP